MADTQEIIRLGKLEVRYLLEGSDTNGQLCLFEVRIPVGAKVPMPHHHEGFDEVVYGMEGVLTYMLGDQKVEIGPGESLFVPRGAVHGFDNFGAVDVKIMVVITPGILSPQFFRDCGALVNAGGPPDIEKIKAVLLRHGLVPAIPR